MGRTNSYYVAAGVQEDVERLLTAFSRAATVRYEHFTSVWKENNMSFIFCGHETETEMFEFTEECLAIVAKFLLPPHKFEIQVGAIYMLYSLYFKQPNNPRAKIRVTFDSWRHLVSLLQELRQEQHLDTEFIFLKLLHVHAFYFTAAVSPTMSLGLQFVDATQAPATDLAFEGEVDSLDDTINLKELSMLHTKYTDVKASLFTNSPQLSSLDVIHTNLPGELARVIGQHEERKDNRMSFSSSGNKDEEANPSGTHAAETSSCQPAGTRQSQLKARAFSSGSSEHWRTSRKRMRMATSETSTSENTESCGEEWTPTREDPGIQDDSSDEPAQSFNLTKGHSQARGRGRGRRPGRPRK